MTSNIDVKFTIRNLSDIQAFTALMQAQEVSFDCLFLDTHNQGGEFWQELAAAFHSNPNVVIRTTRITKQELAKGPSDTIMTIWDATTARFLVSLDRFAPTTFLSVDKSDDGWTRLQGCKKMTDEEFIAESREEEDEATEDDTGSWGEDEGEDTESDGEDEEEDAENEGEDEDEDDGDSDVGGGGEQ